MIYEDINNYCMAKIGAFVDTPFGPFPICYKVGNRIFLEWYPEGKLTLRCEPVLSDYYRCSYPGAVIVGYHCPDRQKPYKNTVYLDRGLDERLIWDMIDISYEEAVKRLRKQDREKLIDLETESKEKLIDLEKEIKEKLIVLEKDSEEKLNYPKEIIYKKGER